MTIPESGVGRNQGESSKVQTLGGISPFLLIYLVILILTASASFGLGLVVERSIQARGQVTISHISLSEGLPALASTTPTIPAGGEVVGSRSSKRYYLPWCTVAAELKETDKVWFADEASAQSDGYVAGGKCPGI